jgi:hypothetical protein
MSWDLAGAQFLGIAYFTHPSKLVGIHTWFISLLILCYVMAALFRWDRRCLLVAVVLGLALKYGGDFRGCVLAFLAGCVVAIAPRRRICALAIAVFCSVVSVVGHQIYLYPLTGTLALIAGIQFVGPPLPWLRWTKGLAYEFYLVHGPIYLGLAVVTKVAPIVNLVLGSALAVLGAMAVSRFSARVAVAVRRLVNAGWRPQLARSSAVSGRIHATDDALRV